MNRAEELAREAQERAAAYQAAAACKVMPQETGSGTDGENIPGKGHGATPEQWPDGACGCGFWGSR